VPRDARAYDVVPIDYELSWRPSAEATFPVAVEAVAFEEEGRRRGRPACDLALPGRIDLEVEYLGSVTAHLEPGAKQRITPDLSDEPGSYPGLRRGPLVRSGVVEAGDLVWYRVRITNTGNTILDAEGLGGCLLYPRLLRRSASGAYEPAGESYNLYVRDLEYLYPGESHDLWLHCTGSVPGSASSSTARVPDPGVMPGRGSIRVHPEHQPMVPDNVCLGGDAAILRSFPGQCVSDWLGAGFERRPMATPRDPSSRGRQGRHAEEWAR
jgi:hypothetical protein